MKYERIKINRCKGCMYYRHAGGIHYCVKSKEYDFYNTELIHSIPLICFKKKNKAGKTYRCDPDKNFACSKTNCYRHCNGYYCRRTFEKQYKMNIFKRIFEKVKYGR